MTYAEQLLHPRWIERRAEIISRDWHICQQCMSTRNLQVHHKHYYNDGRMAWEYPSYELVTLCGECHAAIHKDYQVPTITPDRMLEVGEQIRTGVACLLGLMALELKKKLEDGKEVH